MKILGIETSCDETAASVIEVETGKLKILSNIVSSQIDIHKQYGGVVPEVAAREHVLNILPVINEALVKAGLKGKEDVDAIAVTVGPGLITSLIVGVETAKALSFAWEVPVVAVNHIEGHIYANFVEQLEEAKDDLKFPALVLTVSGGHTLLVLMKKHGDYKIVGETRDDAAGEAFDKAAKLLEIGYPGGPVVASYASKLKDKNTDIVLPRPMINSKDNNFSFSGLKTALFYLIKKDPDWKEKIPEYCYEFEQAVVEVLISKTMKAAREFKVKSIMLAGGVSANQELRRQMNEKIEKLLPDIKFYVPDLKYTTDNSVMIATAGYYKVLRKDFTAWKKLSADSNLELR